MKIKNAGVVGSGIMGSGITQVIATAGFPVIIYDIDERMLEKGLNTIKKGLHRDVEKGRKTQEEYNVIIDRIKTTTNMQDLGNLDVIIEAVFEKMEVKKAVFKQLSEVCKPEAYLITNTSGLSITEIASVTKKPENVVGMHFFNPVPAMKLVEVIKGYSTSDDAFNAAYKFTQAINQDPIAVKEAPLFAVNRILVPMINEAFIVLDEGIASAEDIDKGMKLGANHPMGPLALADLIGLETLLMVIETLFIETGDSKYRPAPLMRKLVRAGKYGRKTGEGVYKY